MVHIGFSFSLSFLSSHLKIEGKTKIRPVNIRTIHRPNRKTTKEAGCQGMVLKIWSVAQVELESCYSLSSSEPELESTFLVPVYGRATSVFILGSTKLKDNRKIVDSTKTETQL